VTTSSIAPVVRERTVNASVDTCFRVFVDGFDSWWPPEHHLGDRTIVRFAIEPFVGGRCYDVDTDGVECQWGTVLALDPPRRLVLAWHIQGDWTVDLDPARQSEIEVTFVADGPERTVVRLEHGRLDRHTLPEGVGRGVSGDGGWSFIVDRFLDRCEGREPRAFTP